VRSIVGWIGCSGRYYVIEDILWGWMMKVIKEHPKTKGKIKIRR
jgi:hypothetical protein